MDFQLFFRRSCAGLFSPGLNYQSRIKAPACVRASQEFSNIFRRSGAHPFSPDWNYQSRLKAPACVRASLGFFDAAVPAPLVPVGITN
jgi:hypothetical protein